MRVTRRRKLRRRWTRQVLKACALAIIMTTFRRRTSTVATCGRAVKETTDENWIRPRARMFLERWASRGHHVRNLVSYACVCLSPVPLLNSLTSTLLSCPEVFYDSAWRKLFAVPLVCVSHGCLSRFGRSHFVYADFVVQSYTRVVALDIVPKKLRENGKVAVMLEPRQHPLLEYVIKQVMSTLGEDWGLQLFLSTDNLSYLTDRLKIRPGDSGENIRLIDVTTLGFQASEFTDNKLQSALSLHKRIYEGIVGEHILWFQLDVVLRHTVPTHLLSWSYVGSEWDGCGLPDCVRCTRICGGGNSGLSLRRKSAFLRIATNSSLPEGLWGELNKERTRGDRDVKVPYFRSDKLYNSTGKYWYEDDMVISEKFQKLGQLPLCTIQQEFAIGEVLDTEHAHDPVGLHKPWLAISICPWKVVLLLQKPYKNIMESHGVESRNSKY